MPNKGYEIYCLFFTMIHQDYILSHTTADSRKNGSLPIIVSLNVHFPVEFTQYQHYFHRLIVDFKKEGVIKKSYYSDQK